MDFDPCLKVDNLVSVQPKCIKLGQMTYLNEIFNVVLSHGLKLKLALVPCVTLKWSIGSCHEGVNIGQG